VKTTIINRLLFAPGPTLRFAGGLGLLSIAGISAPALSASPILADISLNITVDAPPPPPRQEVIVGISPGPDYIWVAGFWDGTPGHYVWVGGHWERPPRPHAVWVAPHWEKDHDGHYHQIRGEWR
jgi:YXWGXW repeat-containing protein